MGDEKISNILARQIKFVENYGSNEEVIKKLEEISTYLRKHPDDKIVRSSFLSLVKKKCEDKNIIIETINETILYLKNHLDDIATRQAFLSFIIERGFFKEEDIKWVIDDATHFMETHGTLHLFGSYIPLILKVMKTKVGVEVDTQKVKEFGEKFIQNNKQVDIKAILNFANFLEITGNYSEAIKLFDRLLDHVSKTCVSKTINIDMVSNIIDMVSNIYFRYGKLLLTQAIFSKDKGEKIKKLKEAEEKFNCAVKINELHYASLIFLYIVLREEGKKNIEDILQKAEETMIKYKKKKNKNEPISYGEIPYKIGIFYLAIGRYEDAIHWLKEAKGKDPENFANYYNLGYAQFEQALLLENKNPSEYERLLKEVLSNLNISLQKAPKLLQLPASKKIPEIIEECKRRLEEIKKRI